MLRQWGSPQGLSWQQHAGGAEKGRNTSHFGAGPRSAALARHAGSAGGSLRESAADLRRARQRPFAAARGCRNAVSRMRMRPAACCGSTLRGRENVLKASANSRGRAQHVGDMEATGQRHTAWTAGALGPCRTHVLRFWMVILARREETSILRTRPTNPPAPNVTLSFCPCELSKSRLPGGC